MIFDKIHHLPPVLKDVTCWGLVEILRQTVRKAKKYRSIEAGGNAAAKAFAYERDFVSSR